MQKSGEVCEPGAGSSPERVLQTGALLVFRSGSDLRTVASTFLNIKLLEFRQSILTIMIKVYRNFTSPQISRCLALDSFLVFSPCRAWLCFLSSRFAFFGMSHTWNHILGHLLCLPLSM